MRLRFFTTAARVHLDIFTLCKCNYSFFSSLTLPFFPPTACIIIYCFSLLCRRWVGGKKIVLLFFLAPRHERMPTIPNFAVILWLHLYLYSNNDSMSTPTEQEHNFFLISNSTSNKSSFYFFFSFCYF